MLYYTTDNSFPDSDSLIMLRLSCREGVLTLSLDTLELGELKFSLKEDHCPRRDRGWIYCGVLMLKGESLETHLNGTL